MTVQELRERSRKKITAPDSGIEFSIRRCSTLELESARLKSIIGSEHSKQSPEQLFRKTDDESQSLAAIAIGNEMQMAGVRYILSTVSPKIVFAEENNESVPEGCIDGSWLTGEDIDFIFGEIKTLSGFNKEAEEQVEAVIKNAPSSVSQTSSEEGTGDAPAIS